MSYSLLVARGGLVSVALGLSAPMALGAPLFSTGFATPTSSDGIPYADSSTPGDNGSKTVGWAGTDWTLGSPTVVDFEALTSVTFGTFTWGSGADTIKAGQMWLTLGGGDHIDGNNSQIRHTGATDPKIQFNSSTIGNSSLAAEPDGIGIFNLAFEVLPGQVIDDLTLSMRLGTGQTNGTWDNNTAAENGNYNVRIVNASNTASGFSFYAANQAIGAGAGPTVNAVDQTSTALTAGTYILQIQVSGKAKNQRYTLDDLSFSATVPEPASLGVAALAAGLLIGRRRRKVLDDNGGAAHSVSGRCRA
jgi:hypothetical protein